MADKQKASVLRRKTRAAREGTDPRVVSPARALRLALARAADAVLDLALVVATVEQRRVEAGEVETALGGDGLYLLLDGAAGARAAMRLCPGLLSGLIEMQTTGHIRPGAVHPRAPTRTDAALVAPLVDALLHGFDEGMGDNGTDHVSRDFHFGDLVEDARALALLLSAPEFDFFRLTVDLGPGLRSGRLDLLLPPASPPPARDAGPARLGGVRGLGAGAAAAHDPEDMAAMVLAAPVALTAVLARIELPLRTAMTLKAGQRLVVPKDSLGKVRLFGAGGHVAAQGRLGRRDGWRALRLAGADAEEDRGNAARAVPTGNGPAPAVKGPDMEGPQAAAHGAAQADPATEGASGKALTAASG